MLAVVAWLPAVVRADAVKVNGFWYENVQIQEIVDGKLYYLKNDAESSVAMSKVGGMKITTYPAVEALFNALEKKDDKAALKAAKGVFSKARESWLKQWAAAYEVLLLDRTGDPVRAVQKYLWLVSQKADDSLLTAAPMSSLGKASAGQKADMAKRIEKAQRRAKGVAAENLKLMLAAVKAEKADAKSGATASSGSGTGSQSTPVPAERAAPVALAGAGGAAVAEPGQAIKSVVPLSRFLDANEAITKLLAAGKFQDALDAANVQLGGKTRFMAQNLYQKGVAQMYLAEKSNDTKMFKNAGLSFARVLAYYDKSSYAGPAALELAYVSMKIGDQKMAARQLQRAQNNMDEESEPELWGRLETLMAQ